MEQWIPEDARILELHHLQAHAQRGANTAENLILLCSRCHDDVHARSLDEVRNATGRVVCYGRATECATDSEYGEKCSFSGVQWIPPASTFWNKRPFGEYVEGLSCCGAKTCVDESAVQPDDFQDHTFSAQSAVSHHWPRKMKILIGCEVDCGVGGTRVILTCGTRVVKCQEV